MLVGGACWVLALALFNTTVQLSTPRWVVGRALALYQTAAFGGMALGSWLWGSVAEAHGAGAGAALAPRRRCSRPARSACGCRCRRGPSSTSTRSNRWTEPEVGLDLTPRSGPIKINVEYLIDEADVPEFLDADGRAPAHPPPRRRARTGRCCATSRTRGSGSRATRPRPGSSTSATTSAAPRPTPTRPTACASCTAARSLPRVQRRIVRQATRFSDDPHPKAPIDHP